jgi:hypothetical protein
LTHGHLIWKNAFDSKDKIIYPDTMKDFFRTFIDDKFLLISAEDSQKIVNAEDEWWMNYNSGVPFGDVTNEIL